MIFVNGFDYKYKQLANVNVSVYNIFFKCLNLAWLIQANDQGNLPKEIR